MTSKLNGGDAFPEVALTTTAGEVLTLPRDLSSPWTVVLFYRGHW